MSDPLPSIRIALESKLATITPALSTSYENVPFTPVTGTPWQACYTMPAEPSNPTLGDSFYREIGLFQVSLFYPLNAGPSAATTRAGLIRTAFKRGTSMTSGGVTVRIMDTPYIGQGRVDGDRFFIPVKIKWQADINP